jgi:hypothetical protein
MKTSLIRMSVLIVLLSCMIVFCWARNTHNLYRLRSVVAETDSWTYPYNITSLEYQYGNNSFFDLQSISADYMHNEYVGSVVHPVIDSSRVFTFHSHYSQYSGGEVSSDQLYTGTSTATPMNREIVRLDSHGRRIYYQVFNSQGREKYREEVIYSSGEQPDYMSTYEDACTRFYIFHYDSLNRKSRVDYYCNQIYQGYYSITYLSEYAHPYQFHMPYIGVRDLGFIEMMADENWRFDHIVFHRVNGIEQQELWWCEINNGFSFRYSNIDPEYGGNTCTYNFNDQGLLVCAYYESFLDMMPPHCYRYTYTWDSIVPVTENVVLPMQAHLNPGFPNPFSQSTTVSYHQPKSGPVLLQVFNIKGQLVKTLVNEKKGVGDFSITWSGADDQNHQVPSGVYFIKWQAGTEKQTIKVVKLH